VVEPEPFAATSAAVTFGVAGHGERPKELLGHSTGRAGLVAADVLAGHASAVDFLEVPFIADGGHVERSGKLRAVDVRIWDIEPAAGLPLGLPGRIAGVEQRALRPRVALGKHRNEPGIVEFRVFDLVNGCFEIVERGGKETQGALRIQLHLVEYVHFASGSPLEDVGALLQRAFRWWRWRGCAG
jgi:hypothetical protein